MHYFHFLYILYAFFKFNYFDNKFGLPTSLCENMALFLFFLPSSICLCIYKPIDLIAIYGLLFTGRWKQPQPESEKC